MPSPLHVPRVNNNDDQVTVVSLAVQEGDFVKRGQVVGAVETDKAVLDVEAECDGYVLKIVGRLDEQADVGSVLLWIGDSPDERVPDEVEQPAATPAASSSARPTAKARTLLKERGLDASQIPTAGDRLTEADIEAWLAQQGQRPTDAAPAPTTAEARERVPDVPGNLETLSPEEHGMLATVLWHRDQAVAGYIETEYDPAPWDDYARTYADENKLMFPPLLPLLAFRLVELAKATPRINATIVRNRRYQYGAVNLGFTVQAGQMLYLTVVRDAQQLDTARFIDVMGEIQRKAMAHKLGPGEMSGATIGFTSMARWNVTRHVPILPPQTSLMVAHSAPRGSGKAVLGASYDHRLLSGFDVVHILQALAAP